MLTTCSVACAVHNADGTPAPGARVRAAIDRWDRQSGFVGPTVVSAITDAAGLATLELWPNALGLDGSAYALTIEAGTPLAEQPDRHPDDDDQADKYELVDDLLVATGLENYEISNWARPGHECRHNVLYWLQQDYRGFGCAAHSHASGRRWWNVRTPDRYIDLVAERQSTEAAGETLDDATRRFERYELLLRMRDGVPVELLDGDALPGLVERRGDHWILTRPGRLLANDIATRLRV